MNITYLHHSSFLVELEEASLIFDYTEGPWPEINQEKPLFFFASHRHGDHFSPVIFEKARQHPRVFLILSDDIWKKRVPEDFLDKTFFMKPNTVLKPNMQTNMTVETFRSTDEGAAFLVTCGETAVYHAGDLNNWRWDGESEQWNEGMNRKYHKELEKMAGRHVDAAFLPLDPRQERWFYLGMDEFVKSVRADRIIPMHFWGDFDVIRRMKELPCTEEYRDRIIEIHRDGEKLVQQ